MSRVLKYAARMEYKGHPYSIFCHKSRPDVFYAVTDENAKLKFCLDGDTPERAEALACQAIDFAKEST